MTASLAALVLSTLALGVSALTAWLTLLRRGSVRLSRPTVLYLGSDGSPSGPNGQPKVHLKALLYCTAKRGRVIESLYVRLARNDASHIFNVWVHGEGSLVRGSGLFISDAGVGTSHHFLLPRDDTQFRYLTGRYVLELFATLAGSASPKVLFTYELELTHSDVVALQSGTAGVYFDWSPSTGRFISHVEILEPRTFPPLVDANTKYET